MSSVNETQRSSMGSFDRKMRYRALLDDLQTIENENNYSDEIVDKTTNAVKEVQNLLAESGLDERVKHPGEGYLDSKVLRVASDVAVRVTASISGNINIYDKNELAVHIRENPDFWCFALPREVPSAAFLYGTFAPTPPELRPKAPRRVVQKQQAQTLKAPQKVNKLDKVDEGSQMVSRVNRFITRVYKETNTPLSYFHTVLDPTSFSATIENIYYISFLVRDTLIKIDLDEDFGLPFITPLPPSKEQKDPADEKQFIVSMDQQRWRELIEAFDITAPMMVFKRK